LIGVFIKDSKSKILKLITKLYFKKFIFISLLTLLKIFKGPEIKTKKTVKIIIILNISIIF
tara:strand:+ start:485 stop:667 length:183 start_codon:yes stop_codon:yes gene_type:complete